MHIHRRQYSSSSRVPELDHVVLAAGDKKPLGRMPFHAFYVPPMTYTLSNQPSLSLRSLLYLPVKTRSSRLSSKDHIRTVESSLAVANLPSSGLKLSPLIASRWPCQAVRLFILGWKYLMMPLWSAEARNMPEWQNCIVRTALSCACNMVSKLKVRPFHSVNSPLVDPVKTRRPSGVHCGRIHGQNWR